MNEPKRFEKVLANWLLNDFMGICRKRGLTPPTSGISAEEFRDVISLHHSGLLDKKATRDLLEKRMSELHDST